LPKQDQLPKEASSIAGGRFFSALGEVQTRHSAGYEGIFGPNRPNIPFPDLQDPPYVRTGCLL
jgi:hypothetical protein